MHFQSYPGTYDENRSKTDFLLFHFPGTDIFQIFMSATDYFFLIFRDRLFFSKCTRPPGYQMVDVLTSSNKGFEKTPHKPQIREIRLLLPAQMKKWSPKHKRNRENDGRVGAEAKRSHYIPSSNKNRQMMRKYTTSFLQSVTVATEMSVRDLLKKKLN